MVTNSRDDTLDDTLSRVLKARVNVEREQITREEASERELTLKRKELLISGTDADLDRVEQSISDSRMRQVRALERIELLEQFLPAQEVSTDV